MICSFLFIVFITCWSVYLFMCQESYSGQGARHWATKNACYPTYYFSVFPFPSSLSPSFRFSLSSSFHPFIHSQVFIDKHYVLDAIISTKDRAIKSTHRLICWEKWKQKNEIPILGRTMLGVCSRRDTQSS